VRRGGAGAGASETQTAATFDSSSEAPGGLSKSYRQAWDNLHHSEQKKPSLDGNDTLEKATNYRSRISSNTTGAEDVRDDGEIVVADYYAKESAKADKKRHHHHHHHKHNKRAPSGADW